MPNREEKYLRRSIRLAEYDYRHEGAYFVTICVHQRACLFGGVVGEEVLLSTLGCVVLEEWEHTAITRPYIILDEFIIMPNHLHGIIVINHGADNVGATRRVAQFDPENIPDAPTSGRATHRVAPTGPPSGSIGAIVGQFKSVSAKRINRVRETPGAPVWQRNYYEHIIRDEKSFNAIREYIQLNPARWAADTENPANIKG